MRSLILFGLIVAVFAAFSSAQPFQLEVDEENFDWESALQDDTQKLEDPLQDEHLRLKRATCDLLSAFRVAHTACAAHCIALGRRGGWCDGRAVCNCRR